MFASTVYENTAFNFELFAISLFNLWVYRKPFTQSGSSADFEGSTFDPAPYNEAPVDNGDTVAEYNAGFVEDDTAARADTDISHRSLPPAVNDDAAGSPIKDRNGYGACNKIRMSKTAHSGSEGATSEACKVCPQCGHDLFL